MDIKTACETFRKAHGNARIIDASQSWEGGVCVEMLIDCEVNGLTYATAYYNNDGETCCDWLY